ncbi:hypothetical protein Pflav_089200 [Phytohabitans flavus]|uniref:Tox-PL domain-containing protein n=1 Tax=Phytohabitans flavus TaxID=1076124 RepID=A0A6F8Y8X5_9ACTN|nr:toxin glutamine deamidase domain-containing protein [Phytohabitans flavus]BCB82510.1 hypothetical protein Pflav_089200 [Phytohabitans flavus]
MPALDTTRVVGPDNLAPIESPQYQQDLQQALDTGNGYEELADPSTHPYGQMVNDGGPSVPGRSNNCLDGSLAALSSFYGDPQVAAPRWADVNPDGTPDHRSGEADGLRRAVDWLGDTWTGPPPGTPGDPAGRAVAVAGQYADLHAQIAAAGPGASALVVADWISIDSATGQPNVDANGDVVREDAHAFVIVYPRGASGPVWWDPQSGRTWDSPPAAFVSATHTLWHIRADHLAGSPAPTNSEGTPNVTGTAADGGTGTGADPEAGRTRDGGDPVPVRVRLAGEAGPDGGTAQQGDARRPWVVHSGPDGGSHGADQPAYPDADRGLQRGQEGGTPDWAADLARGYAADGLTTEQVRNTAAWLTPQQFGSGPIVDVRPDGPNLRVELADGRVQHFRTEAGYGGSTVHSGAPHDPHVIRIDGNTPPHHLNQVLANEIADAIQQRAATDRAARGFAGRMLDRLGRLFGFGSRPAPDVTPPPPVTYPPTTAYAPPPSPWATPPTTLPPSPWATPPNTAPPPTTHTPPWAPPTTHTPPWAPPPAPDYDAPPAPTYSTPPAPSTHTPPLSQPESGWQDASSVPDADGGRAEPAPVAENANDGHWDDRAWHREGRPPSLDELLPQTDAEAARWADAVRDEFTRLLDGREFAGMRVRMEPDDPHAVSVYRDNVTVRLDILDANGSPVGRVVREFRRLHDGGIAANHVSLRLDKGVQGRGFAGEWNRFMEDWYRYSGVSFIEIHAASTVGGYAWARAGYDWAPGSEHRANDVFDRLRGEMRRVEADARQVARWAAGDATVDIDALRGRYGPHDPDALIAEMRRQHEAGQGILDRAARHAFGSPGYPTPNEVSRAGWNGQDGRDARWIGKDALLGANWRGVKAVTEGGPFHTRGESASPEQAGRAPSTPDGPTPDGPTSDGSTGDGGAGEPQPRVMLRDPTPEQLADLGVGEARYRDLGLDRATLTPEEQDRYDQALERTAMVSPDQIRFTQRSVSPETSDGISAQDLVRNMASGGWRGGPVHGVRWGDGSLSSLDNRRLRAAREAGLDAVPFVVHSPNDRLDAWPGEWPADRQARNALGVDIRELPDGRWVAGGDEGWVVYRRGTVPQTYGEMAIFRAAEQRSLLPGHLWGAQPQPVLLAKPQLETFQVSQAEADVLDDARGRARDAADGVQTALAQVGEAVSRDLGLDPPAQLRDLATRIKDLDSLARKFVTESDRHRQSVEEFASQVNDALRFTMPLPDGPAYAPAVSRILADLQAARFTVVETKNFWSSGNRHFGLNATLRSPSGQLFEVQFPTELSYRAGKLTHDLYEVVRRDDESPARRVHAHLEMLAINKRLGLDGAIPPGVPSPVDTSFPAWASKNADAWSRYVAWLDLNGRDFASIMAEFGLDRADLPVSGRVAERLEGRHGRAETVLLGALSVDGGPHPGGDRGPGDRGDGGPRPGLEPSGGGMAVRPGGGEPVGGGSDWDLSEELSREEAERAAPIATGGQELPDEDTIWWIFQWKGDPPQNQD